MAEFRTHPFIEIDAATGVITGWDSICAHLAHTAAPSSKNPVTVCVIELYPGVDEDGCIRELEARLHPNMLVKARDVYWGEEKIAAMVHPDVTDDRIFGVMTRLAIDDYIDPEKCASARAKIIAQAAGLVLVIGTGAFLIPTRYDLLVYADLARWEIQQRMRRHESGNLGLSNKDTSDWMLLYKQAYFVDWRVCDRVKKALMKQWDYVLETTNQAEPKLIGASMIDDALKHALRRPFSLVPFFDPGPWGGQWMKRVCGLDAAAKNYAWCFNCVPEENSVLFSFNGVVVELPAIDLVFYDPVSLLGDAVYARFGAEFPIRFDFLDTMDGGNLSLQVHPTTGYIQEKFGMHYTQDESYYLMDAKDGAVVYLGLKDGVDSCAMIGELKEAQATGKAFDVERHVETWPARKHDHFLIPAGTVHCSGRNSMVLEISATPYIFTFKLWDWGRLGLDGKPRPININHGTQVIAWERTTSWTRMNLVNRTEFIAQGEGWSEEKTGLHEREFIETRRHRFTKKVSHTTEGGVNVLCLVDGKEIVVESPVHAFDPFVVHYAETFIVPASVGEYTISPSGASRGEECITIKAFIRTHA